jgi:hypothetical protein
VGEDLKVKTGTFRVPDFALYDGILCDRPA